MTPAEQYTIRQFAAGNLSLRDVAITIHRKYTALGFRSTPEYHFMSEVDTPSPDLTLRWYYRMQLLP